MQALIEFLSDPIFALVVPVVTFGIGRWWGRRRARKEWRTKSFMHRITVSLNHLEPVEDDGVLLQIRTLLEEDIEAMVKNDVAVQHLLAAADRTTEADPIIHFEKDGWYLLNAVLNEIAEKFADGTMADDLGLPVKRSDYTLCLTNERAGDVKIRKIRAMVMQTEKLANLADIAPASCRRVERENHETRWRTLEAMSRQLETHPGDFMTIEITRPA